MVEAVGVEPTSETTDNREPSCFFRFRFVSYPALRTDKEVPGTSPINLVRGVRAERVGPACSATLATGPQAKLVENGYLIIKQQVRIVVRHL